MRLIRAARAELRGQLPRRKRETATAAVNSNGDEQLEYECTHIRARRESRVRDAAMARQEQK